MNHGIVVATFGSPEWEQRGYDLAVSLRDRFPSAVVHSHRKTLAEARNEATKELDVEWVTFVDADDSLADDFVDSMTKAFEPGKLLQPATIGCVDGVYDKEPVLLPRKNLLVGNYLVIGTTIERERFLRVGGFSDYPILEDWELWIRMVIDGAVVKPVPAAVYVVNVDTSSTSRNQNARRHGELYQRIRRKYRLYEEVLK